MKKFASALAAAAVLGAPAIASAQTEIRPYLTADVGVGYITDYSDVDAIPGVTPGIEKDYQYNDSNLASSVYGLRASHDMGNGLKAVGNLEGDFNTGTGDRNPAGMFRRAANVGLEGAFGRVELGTKMNPLV
ncbi:MAG TPA: porin, partial [Gammaproteobacteria bacterium]|nr:porin [Gammaproteobacteria bacterium]